MRLAPLVLALSACAHAPVKTLAAPEPSVTVLGRTHGALITQSAPSIEEPQVKDCQGQAACQTACDQGRAAGCTWLGYYYARGEGVKEDDARAATLYRRACDAGQLDGCVGLGTL